MKEWLQNINSWHDQEIVMLHTYCHIYITVPKYNSSTSQNKRNHTYGSKKRQEKHSFWVNLFTNKRSGQNQSFGQFIFQWILNMMQTSCKWITLEQPRSLICVTPAWHQATAYSQCLLYTFSYYLQQLMTFLVIIFSKEHYFIM